MPDVAQPAFAEDVPQLRIAVALITEFVSNNILDPHWGFQNTYTGAVQYAETAEQLLELIARLIETLDIIEFSALHLQQLDTKLVERGIPPLATLRRLH